jgi:excisionase family DNA binding protein
VDQPPCEAAEYIRAPPQRVFDLTSQGRLPVRKDGSRNLYRREDLDAYLEGRMA